MALALILVVMVLGGVAFGLSQNSKSKNVSKPEQKKVSPQEPLRTVPQATVIGEPVANAKSKITKKPFGLYVSPGNSPIMPERFTGYHTGSDFEVRQSELNSRINVAAICDGPVLIKRWVSGYGGVIVQSCMLQGDPVTVLYGHIDITVENSPTAGQSVKRGDYLAVLAPAYSFYTDEERKHLHLSIHKGTDVNYLGYVQNKNQLLGWYDPAGFL